MALLTGGGDRPYAFGFATALITNGTRLELIGSDQLDCPEFDDKPSRSLSQSRQSTAGCQLRNEIASVLDVIMPG